ncbi:MAG: D-tyrosyl-tRNA(Tyr) deacylase [Planctomycetaceae bacterium]|nr:D-tyrosyl-tRNA(Tyr) deacylase [Planctomycetaceae bacterium]
MRAVVQRVTQSSVTISTEIVGQISQGLLVLLGVGEGDTLDDVKYLADKIVSLRVFEDDAGKMNRSLVDVSGAMLVVSQFTLMGDCRKGRRPSFDSAAPPELAESLYEAFCSAVRGLGVQVETGRFRQNMQVALINDGPVTLLLDSRREF